MSRILFHVCLCVCIISFCKCNESTNAASNNRKPVTKLNTATAPATNAPIVSNTGGDNDGTMNEDAEPNTNSSVTMNAEAKIGNELKAKSLYRNNKAKQEQQANRFAGQFPEGSERLLADKDLDYLSEWGLKIMLNEIYARHGMVFRDPMLQSYFKRQKWYKGTKSNVNKMLTRTEKTNVAFIKKFKYRPGV